VYRFCTVDAVAPTSTTTTSSTVPPSAAPDAVTVDPQFTG
jgi:hypothetical protein